MRKGLLLFLVLTCAFATAVAAAPGMLSAGHKSISAETSGSSSEINFGWNIAELTKLMVGFGFDNFDPGGDADSESTWSVGAGVHKYMGGMATTQFAPFVGGSFNVFDDGDDVKTGFALAGMFGVEGFVSDNVSASASVGIGWAKQGELDIDNAPDAPTYLSTFTSGVAANVYW